MTSCVVYLGPASGGPFGYSDIIAIVTGLDGGSTNRKTGPAAQLWILPADVAPHEAQRTGDDRSVCGNCALRPILGGEVRCYVRTYQGPLSTWRKRRHEPADLAGACAQLRISKVPLRLGAYGDPAAIPENSGVVQALAAASTHTYGYTHAWAQYPWLQPWCMASVDTHLEAWLAWAQGWRTYRVRGDTESPMGRLEVDCPYPVRGVQCTSCGLCQGTSRMARSITIPAH